MYNGSFNPQYNSSQPSKGSFEDFQLSVPVGWPVGESVLSVAHLFEVGVSRLSFLFWGVIGVLMDVAAG